MFGEVSFYLWVPQLYLHKCRCAEIEIAMYRFLCGLFRAGEFYCILHPHTCTPPPAEKEAIFCVLGKCFALWVQNHCVSSQNKNGVRSMLQCVCIVSCL